MTTLIMNISWGTGNGRSHSFCEAPRATALVRVQTHAEVAEDETAQSDDASPQAPVLLTDTLAPAAGEASPLLGRGPKGRRVPSD